MPRRVALFGSSGGNLITSLIALALVSAVSAMIMAGPRVYAAMAADRALPQQLAWYSKRGVPTVAVVAQGVLGIAVRARRRSRRADPVRRASRSRCSPRSRCGALFILRARGLRGAYRTFGYPVTPLVFIAVSIWIAYAQIKQNPKESSSSRACSLVGGLAVRFARAAREKPTLRRRSSPKRASLDE